MSTSRVFVLVLAISGSVAALGGCSSLHASGMRMGRTYPARPASCDIRYENLTFQEANANYEQVGLVSLSGTSDEPQAWEGITKQRLQPKACEIGGTVVTMNAAGGPGAVMGMGTGIVQFAVWHEKPGAPAAASSRL